MNSLNKKEKEKEKENDAGGWPSHSARGRHDWWTYLERGYADPFREVVRKMADVDVVVDESGRSMLMYALGSSIEIVQILIDAGADVNRRDLAGRAVWDFSPTWGPSSVEKWRALIQAGLDVNSRGVKKETPLIFICAGYVDPATDSSLIQSRCDIVQLLLDAGAEVDVFNQYDDSPLRAAAAAGNSEVVKILLQAGANPNLTGTGTRSALFEAAMHGHARIVQALLRVGAHVEAVTLGSRVRSFPVYTSGLVDVEGVTPLIAAAEGGHVQVVRMLVDAGADVNRADGGGFTPLMGAARTGHVGLVKFLLERGANLEAVDASGKNARTHAVEFTHRNDIVAILLKAKSS